MDFKTIKKDLEPLLKKGIKIAIIYSRVSSNKQAEQGDSLEQQEDICRLEAQKEGYYILKVFIEPYTGRKVERPMWKQLINYCRHLSGIIQRVYILDLDRFNRAGAEYHIYLKRQLSKFGVELKDVRGIIQKEKNTLEHIGFEYGWSIYSPSETSELMKAQSDKEEVRKILTRLIQSEIYLINKGFWVRSSPIGFKIAKIEDIEGKKRAILIPHEKESLWIIKIFEMRAENVYSDQEIVDTVNNMGYKSRLMKKRDPILRNVIGHIGGKN